MVPAVRKALVQSTGASEGRNFPTRHEPQYGKFVHHPHPRRNIRYNGPCCAAYDNKPSERYAEQGQGALVIGEIASQFNAERVERVRRPRDECARCRSPKHDDGG